MSAANRTHAAKGGGRKKRERSNGNTDSDFCPTPYNCALACMSLLPIRPGDVVADFGSGEGVFAQAVHDLYQVPSIAVELYPDRYPALRSKLEAGVVSEVIGRSALVWHPSPKLDWVVMNPPFKQAQRFVEHAMFCVKPGGHVAALLRHGFCVTAGRADFRRRHPAFRMYDLQTRPSFYSTSKEDSGAKTSDATEYKLFVWRVGYRGREVSDVLHWNPDARGSSPEAVVADIARIRALDWAEYGRDDGWLDWVQRGRAT